MGRLLTCVVLCALPLSAAAQVDTLPEEPLFNALLHARSLGMGGAFRSQGMSADATMGNPASMGVTPAYRVEFSGGWDAQTKAGLATASVMDSKSGPVAAGLAYHYVSAGRGAQRRDAHIATAATAFPVLDFLLAGFSTHYLAMTGARSANAMTMDGGLILKFGEAFQLGASGHNLIPIYNPDFPQFWTGSMSFRLPVFNVASDLRMEPGREGSAYSLAAGGELTMIDWLPLRGGWSTDFATGLHSVSGGLGLSWQGGGLDFGYRQTLGGRRDRQLAATLSILML